MAVTTLGSFPGANDKDKSSRIPLALSNLNKALLGDATALAYLRAQALGSATAVGKDAYRRALAIYDAQKTTPAAPPPPPLPAVISTPPVAAPVPVMRQPVILQAPKPAPTATVTVDGPGGQPVGFQPLIDPVLANPPFFHPHLPPSTVTLTSMKPNAVPQINVGASVDGGVIQGPPAPEESGPSGTAPAPADFGYVALSATPATTTAVATTTAAAPSNTKVLIFLALAAGLYFLVEHNKK